MDLSLDKKRALVCGASRGIGRAAATALAELGCQVTLLAREESALAATLSILPGAGHAAIAADLSRPESLAVEGTFHILVNNAGGPPAGPVREASLEDLRSGFETHLLASHVLVRAVLPGMKAEGYGRIVNVVSTSVREPIENLGVSNTVRGAVASWAKTLADELAPFGVTVNNVLPGYTRTERLEYIVEERSNRSGKSREEIEAVMRARVPLGRFADPSGDRERHRFSRLARGFLHHRRQPPRGRRTHAEHLSHGDDRELHRWGALGSGVEALPRRRRARYGEDLREGPLERSGRSRGRGRSRARGVSGLEPDFRRRAREASTRSRGNNRVARRGPRARGVRRHGQTDRARETARHPAGGRESPVLRRRRDPVRERVALHGVGRHQLHAATAARRRRDDLAVESAALPLHVEDCACARERQHRHREALGAHSDDGVSLLRDLPRRRIFHRAS